MERLVSLFGLLVMIGLAWLMSSHKRRFPWRVVAGGLCLQFAFGWFVMRNDAGQWLFARLDAVFNALIRCSDIGSGMVFGGLLDQAPIAFKVLPTIVFFSAFMSVFYHLGVMQAVVAVAARVMQKTLGTSGAETLSAAANIFVGQTEAPLVIRPYLPSMTLSELNAVMVGGFATIAGGVMAAYVDMLSGYESIDVGAKDLLAASVISAPAALVIAKVMSPETEQPKTLGAVRVEVERDTVNLLDAIASGAASGLKLALNVGAMLIVFFALIAVVNGGLDYAAGQAFALGWAGGESPPEWTLEKGFGWLFAPLAWTMGIEWKDCPAAGELLGVKWFATEFVAYQRLGEWAASGEVGLAPRSVTILTYALCGFANFASIGIQLGGIGALAPERRHDLARLGLRAMLGGSLAAFMTACIAGILL